MHDSSIIKFDRETAPAALSSLFHDVPYSPESLYVYAKPGRLEELAQELPERGFAVVGTRRAQPRSLAITRRVIGDLVDTRLIVISGLARGIDRAAHEAAIDAGLPTIAVLAGGFDHIYPPENRGLAARIIEEGGALVTEYDPSLEPRPGMFLRRNRLIAAWARATWVVEAAHRSGALNTAAWARELDRDIFSTPRFPGDGALAGNERLLDDLHARPLWTSRSLGQVWLELAVRSVTRDSGDESDLDELTAAVKRLTAATGAADARSLLDWALAQGWNPARFYSELHSKIKTGQILEKNGSFYVVQDSPNLEGLKKPRESD